MAAATLLQSCFLLFLVLGCRAIDMNTCIKCVCESVNQKPECDFRVGCNKGLCGPYSMTMAFWIDSGSLSIGGSDPQSKYEQCARNKECAEFSIQNYMARYKRDCNGNGVFDCNDVASIHINGPLNCNAPLRSKALDALSNCLQRSNDVDPDEPSANPDDDAEDFTPS